MPDSDRIRRAMDALGSLPGALVISVMWMIWNDLKMSMDVNDYLAGQEIRNLNIPADAIAVAVSVEGSAEAWQLAGGSAVLARSAWKDAGLGEPPEMELWTREHDGDRRYYVKMLAWDQDDD